MPDPTTPPVVPPPTLIHRVQSWLRQTTTDQGLATATATAVIGITAHLEWPYIAGGFAASVVLLAMPGQGDLSKKMGTLVSDAVALAMTRNPAMLAQLAKDAIAMLPQSAQTQTADNVASAVGAQGGTVGVNDQGRAQ